MSAGYSLRDVGKLLGLPRSIICGVIDARFVSRSRGRRREYRFSFQDLVVLRAAAALVEARLPTTSILRSLRRLRTQIAPQIPLSGLRVEAVGDAVVVQEGNAQWQTHDGQYVLRFHVESPGGRLGFLDVPTPSPAVSDDDLFDKASATEYATLLFNLAIVLEDAHRSADAADMYREALKEAPDLPEAHYNLALLCEAARLKQEAIRHLSAYRKLSKR